MKVGRYDDNTWAIYASDGTVLNYGFVESQAAWDWVEKQVRAAVEIRDGGAEQVEQGGVAWVRP
jgi:hypothetical protein